MIILDDFQQAEKLTIVKYDGIRETKTFPFDINGFEYKIREDEKCVKLGLTSSYINTADTSIDTISLIEKNLKK
jgi:hypothetical protein